MKNNPTHLLAIATVSLCTSLSAATTAYLVPTNTIGNQNLSLEPQSLGMDFNVNSAIQITSFGVFDSGGNGLAGPLHVRLYDRTTQVSLVDMIFSPTNSGTLIGGSRFMNLATPLTLNAGFQGVISVSYTTNPTELNGNLGIANAGVWTTDSGGGLISFVGSARHSFMGTGDVYPNIVDTGPANRYAAATFTFVAVPEPSTIGLLGLAGVLFWTKRRK